MGQNYYALTRMKQKEKLQDNATFLFFEELVYHFLTKKKLQKSV